MDRKGRVGREGRVTEKRRLREWAIEEHALLRMMKMPRDTVQP